MDTLPPTFHNHQPALSRPRDTTRVGQTDGSMLLGYLGDQSGGFRRQVLQVCLEMFRVCFGEFGLGLRAWQSQQRLVTPFLPSLNSLNPEP